MSLTISSDNTGAVQEGIKESVRRLQMGGVSRGYPVTISGVVGFNKERPVNTLEASVELLGPLFQGQCLEVLE